MANNNAITKGSTVEVTSDEIGFDGALYVATFLDAVLEPSPTKKKSSNKKNKTIRYLVKYKTLFKDDNLSEPLTETVDPSLVRPLPPRNILRKNDGNAKEVEVVDGDGNGDGDGDGDFELYDVVDAYHRDGWWLGVVKSVIVEGEMRKYVVSFENPPEEFEFEKSKIRLHVDWVDRRWIVPPKKTVDQVLGDRNGSDDADLGFTTPSKGTLVAHVDNVDVGSSISAKGKSRLRTRSETSSAGDISVTYSRNKRNGNSVEGDSRKKRFQSSTGGGKGNTKAIVPVLETRGTDNIHQDSPSVEHAGVITQTPETEDGKSLQKRKRGRPKLGVEKPTGSLEDGDGVYLDEQPLSVWYQGLHPLSFLKRSSRLSPNKSLKQAIVTHGVDTGTTKTDYQKKWPFIKRAPIWVTIESLDLYQTPPQKPHFSPLKKMKKIYREGLAIAMMVTYGNLVQGLPDLQLNDPADIIKTSLETLCELETHGFDVGSVRVRLNELLSLKSKVGVHEDRRKEVESELEKCNRENSQIQKEMDRLKAKMQALKEKTVQTAAMQKTKETEIVKLQTNLDLASKEINDWELAFEKLCKKGFTLA